MFLFIKHYVLLCFSRIWQGWEKFWFEAQSPLPLGVIRLLNGCMLFYSQWVWGLQLEQFIGSNSLISSELATQFQPDRYAWSFWWYVADDWLWALQILSLFVIAMYTLGLCFTYTGTLALLITISNSNRVVLSNYGLDHILSMLTLYSLLGNAGSALSLDHLIHIYKNKPRKTAQNAAYTSFISLCFHSLLYPDPNRRSGLGIRLIQVHYCTIYFFAGISKLQGETWWNGEAVWLAFANHEYQTIDMTWLAHFPWFTQLATHTTILWEISFAYLIWNKHFRYLMLFLGAGMHLGIGLCMGMPTFGFIMIFGYFCYVSADHVRIVMATFFNMSFRMLLKEYEPIRLTTEAITLNAAMSSAHTKIATADMSTTSIEQNIYETINPKIIVLNPLGVNQDVLKYLQRKGFELISITSSKELSENYQQHPNSIILLFLMELQAYRVSLWKKWLEENRQYDPQLIVLINVKQMDLLQIELLQNRYSICLIPVTARGIYDALCLKWQERCNLPLPEPLSISTSLIQAASPKVPLTRKKDPTKESYREIREPLAPK